MRDNISDFSFLQVCNVGYFMNGSSCSPCPGDTIKLTPGNHTDCGELFFRMVSRNAQNKVVIG